MTANDPPQHDDAPRSSETVAILEFTTPSGLTPALAHACGFNAAVAHISGLNPAVASPLPASTSTSPGVATPSRLIVRSIVFAALLASLTWGIFEIRQTLRTERRGPRTNHSGAMPVPAATTGNEPVDELDDATYPGIRANSLLRTHVRRDGEVDGPAVELASVITTQAITVVNLWATWCGPCKAEFSDFQTTFVRNRRDRAWGKETRFVPILVDDEENMRTAYRDWSAAMPDIHTALIDQKLDHGGVRGALREMKLLLVDKDPLPITLLFDCRRRVHWFKIGALDQAAFNVLANEIDKLRDELGQDKCKPKRSVSRPFPRPEAKPPADAASTCNNNGKCEPQFAEDCNLCLRDCPCKPGEDCNPRTPAVCKEAI